MQIIIFVWRDVVTQVIKFVLLLNILLLHYDLMLYLVNSKNEEQQLTRRLTNFQCFMLYILEQEIK